VKEELGSDISTQTEEELAIHLVPQGNECLVAVEEVILEPRQRWMTTMAMRSTVDLQCVIVGSEAR
jgi:hypothetical protein